MTTTTPTTAPTPRKGDEDDLTTTATLIMHKVFDRMSKFPTGTGLTQYDSQATDVIITTYPKAGTTLLQNMAHEILIQAGRKPNTPIDDISAEIPWLDYMPQSQTSHPTCTPRVYKTHAARWKFEEAGHSVQKHIVVIRNPHSFPASWLNFLFDILTDGRVTDTAVREAVFHTFVKARLLGQQLPSMQTDDGRTYVHNDVLTRNIGRWFAHTESWIRPMQKNTLVLFYEDVVHDLPNTVRKVADFMQCGDIPTRDVERIADGCRKGAMVHDTRFRCGVEDRLFGLANNAWKVKDEDTGGFKRMRISEEDQLEIGRQMREVFGVDSYDELKEVVKREQRDLFDR